jgi:hypothetical protein
MWGDTWFQIAVAPLMLGGVEQVEGPPSLLLHGPPPAASSAAATTAPPARQGFAFVVVVVSKALYPLRLELESRLRAALEAVGCALLPPYFAACS